MPSGTTRRHIGRVIIAFLSEKATLVNDRSPVVQGAGVYLQWPESTLPNFVSDPETGATYLQNYIPPFWRGIFCERLRADYPLAVRAFYRRYFLVGRANGRELIVLPTYYARPDECDTYARARVPAGR